MNIYAVKNRKLRWIDMNMYRDIEMNDKDYVCGYCDRHTTSKEGLALVDENKYHQDGNNGVYICSHCKLPTFIYATHQMPGNKIGTNIEGISDELRDLYNEARNAFSVESYTGVILLCRKMLMHIGVELGAEKDQSFKYYVDYLIDNYYVTAKSKVWVDSIRRSGNQSTHQLVLGDREESERLIKFTEMIMKTNFEYPYLMEKLEGK